MVNGDIAKRVETIREKYGIHASPYWVNLLRKTDPHQVGVIKASGSVITPEKIDVLVSGISALDNELELVLPLVLGGGPQYNAIPGYKDVRRVNGYRVTDASLRDAIHPIAEQNLEFVVDQLNAAGVAAQQMPMGVLKAWGHGAEVDLKTGEVVDTQFVGDVANVDTAPILEAISQGKVPVLSHMGIGDTPGEFYNINATSAAVALATVLESNKLILAGKEPGIWDVNQAVISEIKSKTDLDNLINKGVITDGMVRNALDAYSAVEQMGPGRTVQITTPANLVAELLTDGAGTILRMPFNIQSHYSARTYKGGQEGLVALMNDGFSERNVVVDLKYWDTMAQYPIKRIYVDTGNTGGAVVRDLDGTALICKLFRHPDVSGNGLATQLIERAVKDNGSVVGRTELSEHNPSVGFYQRFIDKVRQNGLVKPPHVTDTQVHGSYLVFGINIDPNKKDALYRKVAALPTTLRPAA